MKGIVVVILGVLLLTSCDVNKYTTVKIINQNNFPIEVEIKTNNIETTYLVAANSSIDSLRKFTDIEIKDGKWEVKVTNQSTGQLIKEHQHGQFYNGDLSNFFTMKTKGNYLEFSVDI